MPSLLSLSFFSGSYFQNRYFIFFFFFPRRNGANSDGRKPSLTINLSMKRQTGGMLDVWCLADTRCWMSGNLPWPCSFIWTSKDTSGAEVNLRLREGNSLLLCLKTQGRGWALCTEEEPCDIPCIPAHPLRWGQHRTAGRGMLLATVQPHNPILRFLVPHMWHWRAGEKLLGWKHLIYPFCDRKGQMQAWNLGRFIFIGSLYESISIWIEAEEQEGEKTHWAQK